MFDPCQARYASCNGCGETLELRDAHYVNVLPETAENGSFVGEVAGVWARRVYT
jgi:hypothetical protein